MEIQNNQELNTSETISYILAYVFTIILVASSFWFIPLWNKDQTGADAGGADVIAGLAGYLFLSPGLLSILALLVIKRKRPLIAKVGIITNIAIILILFFLIFY